MKELGFTHNQATVFMYILEHERVRAGQIIKDTGLQRSVVYVTLTDFLQRGLVTKMIVSGVALYSIDELEPLVYEIEKNQKLAKELMQELTQERSKKERTAVIYQGEDIIQRISDKSLEMAGGNTVYFLGPSKFGIQASLESYWRTYHQKRIAHHITCKILYDRGTSELIVKSRNELPLCEARYLPFGTELSMWYIITGDTVGMIVPGETPPLAFILKSKQTSKTILAYFEYLWKQEKKDI